MSKLLFPIVIPLIIGASSTTVKKLTTQYYVVQMFIGKRRRKGVLEKYNVYKYTTTYLEYI